MGHASERASVRCYRRADPDGHRHGDRKEVPISPTRYSELNFAGCSHHRHSRYLQMIVLPYFLAGISVLVGTIAIYFGFGGITPHTLGEWSNFGTYVGGIAGPLLSFVALIAVARTMHLQRAALEIDQARQLADQHVR